MQVTRSALATCVGLAMGTQNHSPLPRWNDSSHQFDQQCFGGSLWLMTGLASKLSFDTRTDTFQQSSVGWLLHRGSIYPNRKDHLPRCSLT